MTGERALEILAALRAEGVVASVDGGWGVDALVGMQTRPHEDLDLVVPLDGVAAIRRALRRLGYAELEDHRPVRFILRDASGAQVDFHTVTFDPQGGGLQPQPGGGTFRYPPEGFVRGRIAGAEVPCVSPAVQLLCHLGYPPGPKDAHDVLLLCRHFGLGVPAAYARPAPLRIWTNAGGDGDPGVAGFALDFIGFTTWAETETELVAKIPDRFADHCSWRARHGLLVDPADCDRIEIVERRSGFEILFDRDREPAGAEEVDLTVRLLAASRADLLALLRAAPAAALDWDPPYRRFASWATWRTIRANLAHVANGETHYYTRSIGHRTARPPADPAGDWEEFLAESRAECVAFLRELRSSGDLARVAMVDHGFGAEPWSVRKALRRLVGHELVHAKSIARILRAYAAHEAGRRG
jgi:lincosamide nucleotidyltransferase A/C/D/E